MNLRASLIIKNRDNKTAANICIGGQSIACSGPLNTPRMAISRVIGHGRFAAEIKNVLVSVDFTRQKLSLEKKISNVLYIQIHPTSGSPVNAVAVSGSDGGITDKVLNFSLLYDFQKGFINLGALIDLIEDSNVGYIAINSPYSITEYNIESILYDLLSTKYPHIVIYPSRHLLNRDFITRGNTLLLNLVLRPYIEQTIAHIKEILKGYNIDCPLYFLRSNGGLVGENTILYTGLDTYQCEELSFLYDIISLQPNETMYIADWNTESLYFVHQGIPQMIQTPIDCHGIRIYGNIPVRYALQDVRSCPQLLELLNAHNPFPGPVPVVSIGNAPFEICRLFEYPAVSLGSHKTHDKCGLIEPVYMLEMETYESRENTPEAKSLLSQTLNRLAAEDGIRPGDAHCTYACLPIKYLYDGKYIIRATLRAFLGENHAADI